MNTKALKKALEEVLKSCALTPICKEEIYKFFETEDFNVFSDTSLYELSLLFKNIIAPAYKFYSNGDFLPNIFVKMED